MKKTFGTALNCIDGRTQIPVIKWMKENFGLDYVDLITEPGMDKVLSKGNWYENQRLKEKVLISVNAHSSSIVAVVGHYDCAANPVSNLEHLRDIAKSVYIVKSWGPTVTVVGLWVDEHWRVHRITSYRSTRVD